ncbi:nuclear transport factor 2 family protein [Vibrio sonorensis]|uniref:nuclear transport factor 2 family protein n=1 Tax=Vibrio sonorensis TaxID=1004316 RepID=UPI0008D923DD|nr:nuclear transport factor 2 family protein [Vibrio sonorensis]
MKTDILILTEAYVQAFNEKNIEKVCDFFSEGFVLTDPAGTVKGQKAVHNYIKGIFDSTNTLLFEPKKILVANEHYSIIEFNLKLDDSTFLGTDIITWDANGKMVTMDAYLYQSSN